MVSLMDTVGIKEFKGILHPFPPTYCDLLLKNKVIVSKKMGNKTYIFNKSIKKFQKDFNIKDYYTPKECGDILSENGFIVDKISYNGSPSSQFDFDISMKTLYAKGYFEKDKFISKYIIKVSFDKCMLRLRKESGEKILSQTEIDKQSEVFVKSVLEYKKKNNPKKGFKGKKIVSRKR